MRKAMLLIVVLCTLLLSGCSRYNTVSEIRTNPSVHSRFVTDDSIQTVIKNVRNKADECKLQVQDSVSVLEEYGEARIEYLAGAHDALFWLVDLHRQQDKTSVDIYSAYKTSNANRRFKILEHGAKNLPGCP